MTIEILGRTPSKKNSRQQIRVHGRTINIPSKAYSEWHRDASYQIAHLRPPEPFARATMHITMYAPDRRAADLSNKFESVADLLVDNRFIIDDNWFVLYETGQKFGGVDKKNPRVVVELIPAVV